LRRLEVVRASGYCTLLSGLITAFGVLCSAAPAWGQPYPAKSIRIIVGAAPGGGTDFVSRLLAPGLGEALGQQVIVDNRPGAGSTLGFELGMRSPPDGYTLTMITPSYSINPSLYPIKFDPLNDFTPLVQVARGPFVVVVHPSLPARTTRELIALAKAKPGQITYGSSGQGAIVHLTTELFLHMAGLKMTHVPYKGGGPALIDLIAGQIQLVFATPQASLQHVKAGRIRALAVTTHERMPAEPAIPTVAESGVTGYEVTNWHGLIGPKGLPRPVVERINTEINRMTKLPELSERLRSQGVVPVGGPPEQLYDLIRREIDQWRKVVAAAGVRIN
jgi:tripartite-type tricarboxylate transporter receptor subunit TctC